jgi:D-glycero-alpha-D-manno-heptose 1-phosphate guanylyltransferase
MEAIVLAGGLGTRLRTVVADLPKPMAPINGRPFLELLLDYWIGQGVRRIVLSVGYLHDKIESALGSKYAGCPISYAVETKPLGTGGGLLLAAAQLREAGPFLALNGDTMFAVPLAHLREFHRDHGADMTLALFATSNTTRYTGVATDSEGRVTAMRGAGQANGGVYLVERRLLDDFQRTESAKLSLEDDLMPRAITAGRRVYGQLFNGNFLDIGVPEDFRRAQTLLPATH